MSEEAWFSGLPESEEDRIYRESINRIKSGIEQGLSFEQAVALIDVKDASLREVIISDSLKVLLAEMHFNQGKSLEELSKKLKVPLKRLEVARQEMLEEVEDAAIEKFKKESGGGSFGPSGNA